jgi:hypothetical protein
MIAALEGLGATPAVLLTLIARRANSSAGAASAQHGIGLRRA